MRSLLVSRTTYSRAEYLSDLAVHFLGVIAVLSLVPSLFVIASYEAGEAPRVMPILIYGGSFMMMIVCSALYNVVQHDEWEWLLKRLDHSAIYLKIAGTYTAFALIAGEGERLIAALWCAALLGIALKIIDPFRFRAINISLYLGMGWIAGVLGYGIFADMPEQVFVLILTSGALYTVGVGFYLWDRLPFHFTIWHVFVLTASLCIYGAMVAAITA